MTLPANWTDGGALFHATNENAVETQVNANTTAITALQTSQLSRLTITISTAITLTAGTTVTQTSGSTIALPAVCDVTALIESGGAPTLPTAVSNTNRYTFKNVSGGNATIATTSSQTIDGSAALPLTLPAYASIGVVSDNANWWVL